MATEPTLAAAEGELLTLVRTIRGDAQALIAHLRRLTQVAELETAAEPSPALKVALQRSHQALAERKLSSHQSALDKIGKTHPELQSDTDQVRAIWNGLNDVLQSWPEQPPTTAAAVITSAKHAIASLENVVFECCRVTIPRDVERRLSRMRVGKALDFDAVFESQLPNAKLRSLILADLAPHSIGGSVDLVKGVIYRLSPNPAYRAFSYAAPVLSILLGAAFLVGIANLDRLGVDFPDAWRLDDSLQLIGAFVLVLGGAVIHLVVENVKQFQIGSVAILAISDGLDWLQLRWVGLCQTVIPVLITVLGLRIFGVGSGTDEIAMYVFAGYSVDSVAGLFIDRFGASAGTALKGFEKQLKKPEPVADAAAA